MEIAPLSRFANAIVAYLTGDGRGLRAIAFVYQCLRADLWQIFGDYLPSHIPRKNDHQKYMETTAPNLEPSMFEFSPIDLDDFPTNAIKVYEV